MRKCLRLKCSSATQAHINQRIAGVDQVPDHANLRCYEWCSDASGYFGPIRTQLLLRGLRPLRSPSDRRADREIRAGIRNPETQKTLQMRSMRIAERRCGPSHNYRPTDIGS